MSPAEVDEPGSVTVTLTITTDAEAQPHRGSGEIRLLATSGTATSGDDFSALDEMVSLDTSDFNPEDVNGDRRYQASVSRTISITDDTLSEGVERFTVSQAATTGTEGTAPGLTLATPLSLPVDINSSDYPAVSIATASGTLVEGTAVTFTLSRPMATAGAALDVTVDVSESGDVVAMAGEGEKTVSFDANETTATLTVATVADTAYEDNSVVTAAIQTGDGYTISGGAATRTVTDDDFPVATAVLSVSATDVEENGSMTATLTITTTMDEMPHGPPGTFRIHTSAPSSGNPAAPGTDYAATNQSVALDFTSVTSTDVTDNNIDDPVYQASESVTINLPDDTEYEGAEHFTVNLSAVTTGAAPAHANVSLEAPTSIDITIAASDLPVVSIAPKATTDVIEGDGVEFTVTRSRATTEPLTVNVGVNETSSLVPNRGDRTVTIPANDATATLTIDTSTDDEWDPHGTVTANILAGTGYMPSTTAVSAVRNVKDNDLPDMTLSMVLSATTVEEGASLTVTHTFETADDKRPHKGTGSITPVVAHGTTDADDGVALSDVDIKADAADFMEVNNVWRATVTQTVTVGDDTDREAAETFQVSYPSGSDLDDKVTAGAAVSITINASDETADDADLTGLAISPGALNETFANTLKTYTATVGGLVSQITITPTRSEATATISYFRVTGMTETPLTDADTNTAGTFEVDLVEGDNVIKIVVTTLDQLYTNTFTLTVTREPLVSISVAPAAVTEGGNVVFTVTRAAATTGALLDVRVTVSEAATGGDMVASTNEKTHTVRIAAGDTSAELSIPTVNDNPYEAHATVEAEVVAGTGYAPSDTAGSVTKEVLDNDFPISTLAVELSATDLDEGDTLTVTVIITVDGEDVPHTGVGAGVVNVGTHLAPNSTAVATDFGAINEQPEFSRDDFSLVDTDPGVGEVLRYRATKTWTSLIVNDEDTESDETFEVRLSNESLSPNVSPSSFNSVVTILASDSSEATLSSLALTVDDQPAGHLNPDFNPATIEYTAGVGNAITQVTVTPTPTHENATVTFPSTSDANSGVDGHQVNLAVSENNLIKVQVTAENGTNSETYTVTVTRTPPVTSLTPAASDPAAPYDTTVEYDITFVGRWDTTVTPGGLPGGALTSRPSSVACTATASSSWRAAGWRAARLNRWRKKASHPDSGPWSTRRSPPTRRPR